ncbi:MAG: hemolysin III family protein [Methanobrevibacter sp.]|nr:hemolysin III family protein [Methanobrevibacter sp.]
MASKSIRIPNYTLGEELFNSISHGIGAQLSVAGLVLMVLKAHGFLPEFVVSLFGATMIILYTVSCVYHALSPKMKAKKVLRVMDHCNVYLLVYGTYIPASILGVGGKIGIYLFLFVTIVTIIGITLTIIDIDKYQLLEVICHLINGWSILIGVPKLLESVGKTGVLYFVLGGVMYTIGSILYGVGKRKKYMHCIFHVFCLLGTFFHFWGIYMYLI